MKLTFLIFSALFSLNLAATTSVDIAKQFSNRNWHYHAANHAKYGHLIDYHNPNVINDSLSQIQALFTVLATNTEADIKNFFPEFGINSGSDQIALKEELTRTITGLKAMLRWDNFLVALQTDRWEDLSGCNTSDPLWDPNCGRRTRGNFAIGNMTVAQRKNLLELKELALEHLKTIAELKGTVVINSGPLRVFQFLLDSRSIEAMIQISYVKASDPSNDSIRKTNLIELGRALIVQSFQGTNGHITNSNSMAIDLEKNYCLTLTPPADINCQLDYIRKLIWDPGFSADDPLMSNLILDPKGIKPLMNSLIAKFKKENEEAVSRDQLLEFIQRAYISLCIAYDKNPLAPAIGDDFKDLFIDQMMATMDYLIVKRDIIGLQMSRSMQELIVFVRDY